MRRTRIVHVITGLEIGGAESFLHALLGQVDRARFSHQVISLRDQGYFGPLLAAGGVPVRAVGLDALPLAPLGFARLARWLRVAAPDVLHCWMYHGNVLGGLASRLAGAVPQAWSIWVTNPHHDTVRRSTRLIARLGAPLSRRLPNAIVYNAHAARRRHESLGYRPDNALVIPGGFDVDRWRPDTSARASVRSELQLPVETQLVGIVGRNHPKKDLRTFLRAAGKLHERGTPATFVMVGPGVESSDPVLREWIREAGLAESDVRLLGLRDDVSRLTAALDVAVSSSVDEGFSKVIGEAMSCAVPCVVTDVGDSARIVGEAGRVVPPEDPDALSAAMHQLLTANPGERHRLGLAARARMIDRFNLAPVVERHERLWSELAASRPSATVSGPPLERLP